jgi:hypothetical protein
MAETHSKIKAPSKYTNLNLDCIRLNCDPQVELWMLQKTSTIVGHVKSHSGLL